jgi:hypothetical protein
MTGPSVVSSWLPSCSPGQQLRVSSNVLQASANARTSLINRASAEEGVNMPNRAMSAARGSELPLLQRRRAGCHDAITGT